MKPSASQGTLLLCIFLVSQMTASDVNFTFYYNCQYSPCIIIMRFSDYWLESFRDCLCSASTSACYVYYSSDQGYYQVYNQTNQTYQLKFNNNNYKSLPKFTCTIAHYAFALAGNIQCYRSSNGSEYAFKSFQFTAEANKCYFMCANLIRSNIYNLNIDNNNKINYFDATETCSPLFTTVTTTETFTTQQPTTSQETTTTSVTTTAKLSDIANSTICPDYNCSQTNTSRFGDTTKKQDTITDTGLITGVIIAIVAVFVIVFIIVFLWRRRMKKLNHENPKDENTFTKRQVKTSDPNAMCSSESRDQIFLQCSNEKKGQSAANKVFNETTSSENYVEYSTVKKESERQPTTVSTSLKLNIDTGHTQNEINSLASTDSIEVDLDPQYCNINKDTTPKKPNTSRKANFNIASQTKSEDIYNNSQNYFKNKDDTNILKATPPVTFAHPTKIDNDVSDNETSVVISPAQTTADVYAKLGNQNKELTNPYNTLSDNAD